MQAQEVEGRDRDGVEDERGEDAERAQGQDGANSETITTTVNRGRMGVKSQFEDYKFRGHSLNDFNILQFIVNTYEEVLTTAQQIVDVEGPQVHGDNIADFHEESARHRATSRGRQVNDRWRYLESHSRARTAVRVVRTIGHNTLPSIVGPFLP